MINRPYEENETEKPSENEKLFAGILCPVLFWSIFVGYLAFLYLHGRKYFAEKENIHHLLDITAYASTEYYSFGPVLLLCSLIAIPMVLFRLTLFRQFGTRKGRTYTILGFWITGSVLFQIMAWTTIPENDTCMIFHFCGAIGGFGCLILALFYDQYAVFNISTRMLQLNEKNLKRNKRDAVICFVLLSLTVLSWAAWLVTGFSLGEWAGVLLLLTVLLIWIPQNLRLYEDFDNVGMEEHNSTMTAQRNMNLEPWTNQNNSSMSQRKNLHLEP